MGETGPKDPGLAAGRPWPERALERWLFASRWLLAPFYAGLTLVLVGLLWVFALETWHAIEDLAGMGSGEAIVTTLSLIDLVLTANLVLIVVFAGYENFVSRIDIGHGADRLEWMGTLDFSSLKLKLMASLIAITAVALLRGYLQMVQGAAIDERMLGWLAVLHVTFVVSALLLALTDWIAARTKH